MRRGHLDAFQPVCPACRARDGSIHPVQLTEVWAEEGPHVLQGMLRCPAQSCQREYPIIDGVPLLIAQIREQVGGQALGLLMRQDLHPALESLVGDCCGPNSGYDTVRRYLSHYAVDHWGDADPDPWEGAGAILRLVQDALELGQPESGGLAVDLGCSVGRSSFELAARTDGLVVGVDLNLSMLRMAARTLRTGRARYPRRRVGVVFDVRDYPVDPPATERVDFWAADALALPFAPGHLATALSLNLLDCLGDPHAHLQDLARLLKPGGTLLMATPYDWSPSATRFESWIGGHSQRGQDRGASEARLRQLLTPEHTGLSIQAERDDVPWEVRSHARSRTVYSTHLIAARRG